MSLDRLNINCRGWAFSTVNNDEANFYAAEAADISYEPFTDVIDLKDFLTEDSRVVIRNDFEYIKEKAGSSELLYTGSDLSLQLDDIKLFFQTGEEITLSKFFFLTRDWIDTQKIPKWKVEILWDNLLIWTGTIAMENLQVNYSADESSHIIEVTIIEYIKEMCEWLRNEKLPNTNEAGFTGTLNISVPHLGGPLNPRYEHLNNLLETITTEDVDVTDIGSGWKVINTPVIYRNNLAYWFMRSGYERAAVNNCTRFDFLQGVCGSMGWNFYNTYNSGQRKLVIRNRATASLDELEINADDIIDYSVSKSSTEQNFTAVLILTGINSGGDRPYLLQAGGNPVQPWKQQCIISVSDTAAECFGLNHFSGLNSSSAEYTPVYAIGHSFMKYNGEDENTFRVIKNTIVSANSYQTKHIAFSKDAVVFVNSGTTGNEVYALAFDTKRLFPVTNGVTAVNHNDFVYGGNFGGMLFQTDVSLSQPNVTYDDWIAGPQFRNNWLKFLSKRKSASYLRIKVKGAYPDIHKQIKIINADPVHHPGLEPGSLYAMLNAEIDLLNDETTYELQKVNG